MNIQRARRFAPVSLASVLLWPAAVQPTVDGYDHASQTAWTGNPGYGMGSGMMGGYGYGMAGLGWVLTIPILVLVIGVLAALGRCSSGYRTPARWANHTGTNLHSASLRNVTPGARSTGKSSTKSVKTCTERDVRLRLTTQKDMPIRSPTVSRP